MRRKRVAQGKVCFRQRLRARPGDGRSAIGIARGGGLLAALPGGVSSRRAADARRTRRTAPPTFVAQRAPRRFGEARRATPRFGCRIGQEQRVIFASRTIAGRGDGGPRPPVDAAGIGALAVRLPA